MDGSSLGVIGAVVGALMGFAGGIVGTYFGIVRTRRGPERAFMFKCAAVTWIVVLAFLALQSLLPNPYRQLLWIPYVLALTFGIRFTNARMAEFGKQNVDKG